MKFAVGVLAVLAAVAAVHAQQPTVCQCASASFDECVFPTAQPGMCESGACAGGVCDVQGKFLCQVTTGPVYTETQGGCVESEGERVTPYWNSQTWASPTNQLAPGATPAQAGDSEAVFIFWGYEGTQTIFFTGEARIAETQACGGGMQSISMANIHELDQGSDTGPARWLLCGNMMNPCPGSPLGGGDRRVLESHMRAAALGAPGFPKTAIALAGANYTDLIENPTQYYVNVATFCAPTGLIRGPVNAAGQVIPGWLSR